LFDGSNAVAGYNRERPVCSTFPHRHEEALALEIEEVGPGLHIELQHLPDFWVKI
jgi:hypothetical protein